ncbi:uncharacterized protein FOMMEDRAFT_158968 [Fomitiporia mediterranea MF3/22]|uniref:uncharacterized protein n=1 Tax=Fomitiporia mediterranea (strain MF3/22) TaxID=694068 RepID=UPI0004407F86|nr:uncharacterized protein FOMMEDRAFT_158968 [Fomitiporia mediterranea MF3/22]EJD00298.1 hypothetical protein FOMMEDRAFT_158968 [Fomitiporia mediterranea MF3/22]
MSSLYNRLGSDAQYSLCSHAIANVNGGLFALRILLLKKTAADPRSFQYADKTELRHRNVSKIQLKQSVTFSLQLTMQEFRSGGPSLNNDESRTNLGPRKEMKSLLYIDFSRDVSSLVNMIWHPHSDQKTSACRIYSPRLSDLTLRTFPPG